MPLASTWRYLDNGSNQGTAWRDPGFVDTAWAQGPAELGYGDGGEATVVSFGSNSSAKHITTYFRKSFNVTGAAAYTTATLRVRRDDGVVIYLNGTEIYRNNLPTGTITHTTLAPAAIGGADESALQTSAVSAALLVEGSNILAVEMHQNAANSSDLSFDMDFTGTIPGNTPVANAQAVAVTEDTAKAITLTGSDPNGDPLTFTVATQPSTGFLTGAAPSLTYTPNLNATGADSFTFTVNDGTNTSAAATVSLTIAAVNDVPLADAQNVTLAEEGAADIVLNGSDVESVYGMLPNYAQQLHNGSLTGIIDGLSGATYNADTGTLFLIRNVSGGAGHSYEYTADGTMVRSITQTGFVDTEGIAWMYGTTYAIAEENDNQRISIVTIAPGATTLDRTAAGNVTWTTPVGSLLNLGIESLCYDAGRDVLYYIVEKPVAGAWPVYSMNPQTGVSTVLCDVNTSIATAGVATDLSDAAFDRATDTILFISHESSKIIRISRTGEVLEQRGFTTALTQAEMIALTPDRLRLWVGGEPKQFTRIGLPADTLTYNLITSPAHGSLSGIPPRLTYTPVPNYNGPDSFTFRMWDGTVFSPPATVTLNVTPLNDPPTGGGLTTTAEATEPTLIVLPVSDPDGDELTIQTTTAAHGTLSVDGPNATYTGDAGYDGPDSFTYTVSDGEFTAGPFTVNLTVLSFNVAPVANNSTATLDEDTPAALTLVATDAENDPLTWTIVTPPAHGTLSGTAPALTFTPAADYHGADSFSFRVNDGQENSNTATVSLTIAPVNDAPVANAGSGSIEASYPLPLTLAGSDVDGDALTYSIVDPPLHGTLTGTAPNVTYTADIAWAGADSFTFTTSDGTLTSAPATVTLTVAPYNLVPVANSGSSATNEDTATAVALVATDPESAPLTYNILTPPANGTLSGTAPNLTYTPSLNFSGSDSFSWTASDATKTSTPATVNITVNPVNDAPAVQAFSISTETNISAPVTLSGSDLENDPLTFGIVTPPANGTLSGTPPALTYTPGTGFTGADSFIYTANDGALDSTPATVSLIITAPALDNLVSAGSAWKYLADGSNQGTAWRAPSFSDVAWPQGNAQLGYGDGDEATVVPYGPDANNRWVTTYFRREFQVPNPNVLTGALKLELLRDDGAIVYLNGTEVFRSNMPATTVAYNTLASSSISAPAEQTFYLSSVSSSLIVPGRNVLAVEVHNGAPNSGDVSFDLKLYESNPAISRGPYIQMTGPDRATVRWRTDVPVVPVLNYGLAENALTSSVSGGAAATEHEFTLTGLTPDTRYYYGAGYSLATLASGPTFHFTTHPPVDTARPFRFWVLGDAGTATTSQTTVRDAFYTWNGAQYVDGVLLLGDNVYETGTDPEYQTKFFDIYPTRLRNTTFWPCFGNHDAGQASSATQTGPYYQSFTMPKFAEVGGLASGTEAYYSFDYGNIHFVCLDSEGSSLSGTGAMAQWLQADLAANHREWLVAFWHHPPYSKGSHDSDNPAADSGKMTNMRQVIVPILESFGVDLLLFGHEHAYFRTSLVNGHYGVSSTFNAATMLKQGGLGTPGADGPYLKPSGPNNGAVYTVAGSSGKLNSYTRTMPVLSLNINELGSFVLDVNGREMTARFLNNTGVVRDTFAIVHNDLPVASAATFSGSEDTPLQFTLNASDADNDPLTWEIVTPPAGGTLTGTAPGLAFTPPADFNGTATLEFRVHDGRQNSATATVSLNIAPVNDFPLATAGSATSDEDTPAPVTLTGSDVDGDALTFTVTTQPAHGTLSGTAPALVYTPDTNWHGTDSFQFTAHDGTAVSTPAAFNVTVTPVNDAPVATSLSLSTDEDVPANFTLTGSDADGDALNAMVLSLPAHGTLSGTLPDLTYIPDPDWHGGDSFTFAVTDGPAVSEPVTVSITAVPVNDRPVPAAQSLTGAEDGSVSVTLAASDADGDTLTFSVVRPPSHGTLSGAAPNLTYTPDADWHGLDSFSFTASDAAEASLPVAVTIEITPVNDAPVALAASLATNEDATLPIVLAGTDTEGDPLTFTVTTPPAHGTLSGSTPVTYTPDANYSGPDSFCFTASDGASNSPPAVVTVAVAPVNDPPVPLPQSLTGDEDTPLPATLTSTDVEGDAVTYTIVSPPLHGTLSGTAPDLIYTPAQQWSGEDSFSFIASDNDPSPVPALVSLIIAPVNDVPAATAQSLSGSEDTPLSVVLTGSDEDGDSLSFFITIPPAHGTLSGTGPELSYTPDTNWHGNDSFAFTTSDGVASSGAALVEIVIAPVNDTALASAGSASTSEETPVAIILTGSDAEGDALTYTVTTPPAYGTLSGTAPALLYTPDANWHGADIFEFTASDGTAASAPASFTMTITPVNDTPAADPQTLATNEDTPLPISLAASDTDGDTLTFTITVLPAHGVLSGTAPELTYTPEPNWHGDDSFAFIASDGTADSAPAVISISVAPVNDAPLAAAQSLTADEDAALPVTLTGTDAENEPLTFTITVPPQHGSLSGTAPDLTYTPAENWNGPDSFAFTASDAATTSVPAIVSITVTPGNDAPAAAAVSAETTEDAGVNVTLSGSDLDGDALSFAVTSLPAHGTLSGTAPELTYTPDTHWHGTDTFTYTVTDGTAVSAPATVTVLVTPVNDRPVATVQSLTIGEDTPATILLAATDADGDALTFAVNLPPSHGTLSGTAPNLTYTPDPNWHGLDSFSFTASDAVETSLPVAVTIEVTPANDAPAALAASLVTAEDTVLPVTLTGIDVESDALTFTITTPPAHGILTGTAPDLTYTPEANWNGSDSFVFTTSDAAATSAPAIISIEVTPVNDLPSAAPQSLAVDEDTPLPVMLAGADAENDPLTFTVTVPPAHGSLSGTAPSLTYTPDANFHGTDSFAFVAHDDTGTGTPGLVDLAIAPVNDAPSADPQNLAGDEDTALPILLTGTDTDGDPLTFTVITLPAHGILTGTAPNLIYTPDANWNGLDTLQFTASDGPAASAPTLVSIATDAVNDVPLASGQNLAGNEDNAVPVTLSASDADGDSLTFTVTVPPLHGTLSGTAPELLYTPDGDWNGTDAFAFTASDGTAASPPAAVTIAIASINDVPAATAVSAETTEDAGVNVTLSGSDADGDTLSTALTSLPAHGTLSGTAPELTYTPAADWHGTDTFTYTVTDGTAVSAPATVTVLVTPVNDRPVATAQSLTIGEDTPATILLAATDADGDALTFAVNLPPSHGTLSGTAPNLTYTPDPNWHGLDSFSFSASDAVETSLPVAVTIEVTPANDAPLAAGQSLTGDEDTALAVTLMATDADGDTLSFTVTLPPAHGTLSGTAPNLIYTPDTNWHGSDGFVFTASDASETSLPVAVLIEIASVNDAPVVTLAPLTADEDTPLNFIPSGTDADGDALTFSITSLPAHGTLSGTPPLVTYTPEANFSGTDVLQITASDGNASSTPATVNITVVAVNDLPVPLPQMLTTDEDTPLIVTLAATDVEDNARTFTIITAPQHGTLSGTAPDLIYTPNAHWHGEDSFLFYASDTESSFLPALVNITIAPVNDLPAATPQTLAGTEDAPLAIILAGTDADDELLTFAITTPPQHGSLTGTPPNLTYTPDPDWHGSDSFEFTAYDSNSASAPAVVALTITPVNDEPFASPQSLAGTEDTALPITLAGTDADGDTLTFTVTVPPAHGTLAGTAPDLIYTPDANWNGSDAFSYTVSDGTATSAEAVVGVVIASVNDAPVAVPQSLATGEDTALPVTLAGTDVEGDTLAFAVLSPLAHGMLTGTAPNLTYTPDADWHGTDSFTFTTDDGVASSAAATVVITVSPENDAPLVATGSAATDEDNALPLTLQGSDVDGDVLSYAVLTPPVHGTLSGTPPALTYTPDADWNGGDSFTFIANDGTADSAPGTFNITVTPVNDAPLATAQSLNTDEDTPLLVTLAGSDVEGDPLTFSITTPPANGTLSGTAPNFTYTPTSNWNGTDSFTYTVGDGTAASAASVITVTVNAVNDAPVTNALAVSTEVGALVSFTLTGSDVEGGALTWQILSAPDFGTLGGTAPAMTYTPNLAFSGSDSFTFRVSDGSLNSPAATVTITVAPSGPWQLVVRTGHVVPGTGAAISLIQPDFVSDAAGRASFRATAGSVTGIWTEGPAGLEPVIVQGAAASGVSGAVYDAVTTGPWAAGAGELLLHGKLLPGAGGVTTSDDLGYWHRSGGAAALVARENQPVPSLPAAARFNVLSAVATLEAGGNYAFAASLRTNSSLGISSANDTGLWGTFGAPARLIVRENDAAPGGGGGLFDTLTTAALRSNGDGQLAFSTAMKVAGSITTANRFGLWLWDPLQFGIVARGGNQAPGTPAGAVFAQPQQPSLGGVLGFRATLGTSTGGVTNNTDTGLWSLENGSVVLLIREGSQAPGIPASGLFNGLTEGPVVNSEGDLTFRASLRTGGGVSSANNAGVWSRSPFTGGALTIVARKGSIAPGAGTGTFSAFDVPSLANDGSEAFTATLTQNTSTGVTAANDRGLWVRSAAGPLALALREGTSFTLAPGDTRTISAITLPTAQTSGRTPLSDEGRLLVLLGFSDGTTALYHYSLP